MPFRPDPSFKIQNSKLVIDPAHRPSLRHNDRVVGTNENILAEIPTTQNITVVDADHLLFSTLAAKKDDLLLGSPLGKAPGHGEGLQHG